MGVGSTRGFSSVVRVGALALLAAATPFRGNSVRQSTDNQGLNRQGIVAYVECGESPRFDPYCRIGVIPDGAKRPIPFYINGTGEEITRIANNLQVDAHVRVYDPWLQYEREKDRERWIAPEHIQEISPTTQR